MPAMYGNNGSTLNSPGYGVMRLYYMHLFIDFCLYFYDLPLICFDFLKIAPFEEKQNSWWGSGSGVKFAFDTDIPQQRRLQPAFTVRKMIYFRVEDLRKLEDFEHDF